METEIPAAQKHRIGRRHANARVEAWLDNRARLFVQATSPVLVPIPGDG